MKEQYSNVCRKIIEIYRNFLSEKEIIALNKIIKLDNYDNLNIKIFIHKIIDRIWNMTLTNPKKFINGKPFTFLVTRDIIPIEQNINDLKQLEKHQKHFLELITDDTIIDSSVGINGIIVEIDYINSFSDVLLPCDFKEKNYILANTKLNIMGIYNTSLVLGTFDVEEKWSSDFANLTKLQKIDINKAIYNYKKNKKVLTKNDKDTLANILIYYYLNVKNLDKNSDVYKIRDDLKKLYGSYISNEYVKYFNNQINLEEYINNIFQILDNEPILQMFDKTM